MVPRQHRTDALVDRLADAVDDGRVAQPQRRCMRRLGRADAPKREARRADALKIHVAGEVVAARTQRLERRGKPRRKLDEAADRRRRAFSYRHAHAFELLVEARSADALNAHHDTVGALALFAGFDEATDLDIPCRHGEHGMGDERALAGGGGKSRGQGRCTDSGRKRHRPMPDENRDRHCRGQQHGRRPWRRLAVAAEIDDDTGPEADREPRHQAPGHDLGRRPFADLPRHAAEKPGKRIGPNPSRPSAGRCPGPPCLSTSARSRSIDHRAALGHPPLHRGAVYTSGAR